MDGMKAKVCMVVEYDVDADLFQNIEELKDRARERGEVVTCKVTDLPSTIDFSDLI